MEQQPNILLEYEFTGKDTKILGIKTYVFVILVIILLAFGTYRIINKPATHTLLESGDIAAYAGFVLPPIALAIILVSILFLRTRVVFTDQGIQRTYFKKMKLYRWEDINSYKTFGDLLMLDVKNAFNQVMINMHGNKETIIKIMNYYCPPKQ
jgi:hypothetical protein